MKLRIAIILLSVPLILPATGCRQPTTRPTGADSPLPPHVVGTWKARKSPWKIVLAQDGTVSSAVIDMGRVEVTPNQTTKVQMKDGSWSTFKPGDCIVEYTAQTRELFVGIRMDEIHVVFADNVIDGNSVDRFIGPVSEDGKVWSADWVKIFDYGPRFPQDPNEIFATPLIFEKIED